MKNALLKTGFMCLIVLGVGLISLATIPDGGYSAEGMAIMEQAHGANDAMAGRKSWSSVFEQPRPPAQALLAISGFWMSDPSGQLTGATVACGVAMALAIGFAGLAAWRLGGAWMGIVAAGVMFFAPGTLFHARTLGPEAIIALSMAFLVWVSTNHRATVSHAFLAVFGFVFAMASSHDGIILFIPWVIAAVILSRRTAADEAGPGRIGLGAVSPSTFLPLIVAPILLFWLWPYLHTQGATRWFQVLTEPYRMPHPPILVGGDVLDAVTRGTDPNFGVGMLGVVGRIPVALLVLTVLGAIRTVRAVRRRRPEARASFALCGGLTLVVLAALNGGSFYAGWDGLMAVWPCIAVLSALAIRDLSVAVAAWFASKRPGLRPLIVGAVSVLCIGPSILAFASIYPMETHFQSGILRMAADGPGEETQLNPGIYMPRRSMVWLNQHMAIHDIRLGSTVASERFRPFLDRLIRFGQLPSSYATAEPYDATHVWVPYLPGEPLYADVQAQWNDPIYEYVHRGTCYVALHPR